MFLTAGWHYFTGKYQGKNVVEPSGQMSETTEYLAECITSGRFAWAAQLLFNKNSETTATPATATTSEQDQLQDQVDQQKGQQAAPIKFRITVHRAGIQKGVNYASNNLAIQCGASTFILTNNYYYLILVVFYN